MSNVRRQVRLLNDATARQLAACRAASPKRADAGAYIAPQQDAGHLPLFKSANEPELF